MKNVKWVFVSNWAKNNSEKLLDIKYNNVSVVPCLIDENKFEFKKMSKSAGLFDLEKLINKLKYSKSNLQVDNKTKYKFNCSR